MVAAMAGTVAVDSSGVAGVSSVFMVVAVMVAAVEKVITRAEELLVAEPWAVGQPVQAAQSQARASLEVSAREE